MAKDSKVNLVLCSIKPDWLGLGDDSLLDGEAFFRILRFYVVDCPHPSYATRGRTLQYYHWDDHPWRSNRYLKSELDRCFARGGIRWLSPIG